jgi:hypothetical protein
MIYDPGARLGQAKVAPCKNSVTSFEEIEAQAIALWKAEQSNDEPPARPLSANWGCVALRQNPSGGLPQGILDEWARRVSRQETRQGVKDYDPSRYKVNGGVASIDEKGLLGIPWPEKSIDGKPLDGFDLLLATATEPNPRRSCTVDEIAEAWNQQPDQAYYFHCNRRHDILTFQDDEIAARLDSDAMKALCPPAP